MLEPNEIERIGNLAQKLLDPVTNFLIADITRRIADAGQITGTAAYQVWRLQHMGLDQEHIKKRIAELLDISLNDMEKIVRQSAEEGHRFDLAHLPSTGAIPFSENRAIQDIVNATVKMAGEELHNITQTMGIVAPDGVVLPITEAYQQMSDAAYMRVATGAQDMQSAVRDSVRLLVNHGVQVIDYESGVHTSVEAAVRRNIMSTLGNMQAEISQRNHDEMGADGWEISAHFACAPDHEPIQGKQYTDAEYQSLNASLVRRIGTLNCGHAAFPIILGVSLPTHTPEELAKMREDNEKGVEVGGAHYTTYEATQKQRAIERAMRRQKRRVLAEEQIPGSDQLKACKSRLNALSEEYKRFSDEAGLRTQWSRTYTTVPGAKY